jgi:hypothetical protein
MILMLISLIAITSFGFYGVSKLDYAHGSPLRIILTDFFCPFCAIFGLTALLVYCPLFYSWVGAGHKADIINKQYGTTYTQEQVFYAGDAIEEVYLLKQEAKQ